MIPLIHLPDVYGVGPRVKGGPGITPLGEWRFENLWLEGATPMMFRTRLLLIFTVAIVAAVAVVESAGAGQHAPRPSSARRRSAPSALVRAVPQRVRPAAAANWCAR